VLSFGIFTDAIKYKFSPGIYSCIVGIIKSLVACESLSYGGNIGSSALNIGCINIILIVNSMAYMHF
jgi:hypothetical protein